MEQKIFFGMIPYNTDAPTEALKRRGVSKEFSKGSFEFDVLFTTNNQPGFVVQYIRKTLTYKNNKSSSWITTNHDYWEIFYISKKGESWNADRFAQTALPEPESEGCFIQIGYAYFFPYSRRVKMVNNNIQITPTLKKIFGDKMILGGIPYANGLPSSEEQPAMKGLKPLESAILHKLTGNWGPHVERSISMPSAGWNTIVDEEVFSGPLIYDTFPWDYDKDRPLLKDKTEKRQHLTTKQWKTADIDFVRPDDFLKPFLKCHICKKNHARELWQYYHPTRISPVKFQMWSKSG